jgi:hypothetical protein
MSRRLVYMPVAVALVLAATGLVAWLIQAARESEIRHRTRLNFGIVGMSLHNFSEAHGQLPQASIKRSYYDQTTKKIPPKSTDRPLFSWRVEIYSYMESWHGVWDPSRAWDDPLNKQLAAFSSFYAYRAAQRTDESQSFPDTNLLAITGPGTAFGDGNTPPRTLTDISPNTLLVVETRASGIPWPAPGDFDIRTMPQTINAPDGKGISGRSADGFHVIFADGEFWFLSSKVPFGTLKNFFTTKDAAKYSREELLGPFVLHRGP